MKKICYVVIVFNCLLIGSLAQADSSGFRLKTDVIANDDVAGAEVGDFPIRGQLFLEEMTQQVRQLKEQEVNIKLVQTRIDFTRKIENDSESGSAETAMLFQDYHPIVVVAEEETLVSNGNWKIIFFAFLGVCMAALGGYLGVWWAKRRSRKR